MIGKLLQRIPPHRKGLVYISFTALLWSSSGFFIKYLTLNAFQISFYRSSIAALTIYITGRIRNQNLKFDFSLVTMLAAVSYAGILLFFVMATKMTTAANAIFLQFTAPIYLLVLEPLVLKTKFESRNLITILFVCAGMVLFFFGRLEIGNIYGNIIAIISGICFALFTLFLKWKRQKQSSESTLISVILGNMIVAFIALIVSYPELQVSSSQAGILLYMGVIQIGISYMIFNEGIKYVSATESMIIASVEAIFNPIWVFIGIGEVPSVYSIIGGIIIMGAILWRNFSKGEKGKVIMVE